MIEAEGEVCVCEIYGLARLREHSQYFMIYGTIEEPSSPHTHVHRTRTQHNTQLCSFNYDNVLGINLTFPPQELNVDQTIYWSHICQVCVST